MKMVKKSPTVNKKQKKSVKKLKPLEMPLEKSVTFRSRKGR